VLTGTVETMPGRFVLRDAILALREADVRCDLTLPAWGYCLRGHLLLLGSLAYRDLIDRETFAAATVGRAAWVERN
jgi:hypothetical protein